MGTEAILQISLLAAFIAGMVALFAPCCISYLLPAYFGNIFKERSRILLMTTVYSLGIFVVMLPVVLGARAISNALFEFHDQTYIIGGVVMILVSITALLGLKFPMPNIKSRQASGQPDILSTFTLGLVSGVTSACCAPVLLGVITLSSFSASSLQAVGVGIFYVLGMVTPLYISSFFIHKHNILNKPIFRKVVTTYKMRGHEHPITISNIVSAAIFFIAGAVMLVFAYSGSLGVESGDSVTKVINNVASAVSEFTKRFPIIDVLFIATAIYIFWKIVRHKKKKATEPAQDKSCHDHKE